MTNLEIVIHNSSKANDLFHVDRHEASMFLGKILELTFTQPDFLSKIPEESAGIVGQAYLNLLDLVNEQKFFQTLSTLCYYFISRGLENNPHDYNLIDKRILLLNMGAQTFCRTIAKSKGLPLQNYINFADWEHLPIPVKYVLMLEYKDFENLQAVTTLPHDLSLRKQWLDGAVSSEYFSDICSVIKIPSFTLALHNDVMEYLENEIVHKGTFYFYG